jgi:3-methyladenine DNA glycosylase/8-oxoguanine DNA glycosylase
MKLKTPGDYLLRRDVCSYGYFLLSPNHWNPRAGVFSRVTSLTEGPALIEVTQGAPGVDKPGADLAIKAHRALSRDEKRELTAQLIRMLRLDEDASTFQDFHQRDPRFAKIGRGRLFRSPTLFEDVIKTVTSCNVTWPNTVNMNRRICEVLGDAVDAKAGTTSGKRHAFPSAKKLARTRPATLRSRCRVGYRDERIIELARLFTLPRGKGGIDAAWMEDPATPDDALYDALIDLPGIGPYAAANILQLLGRYHLLPCDTESVRHGKAVLGMTGTPAQIMKKIHEHFAPMGRHAFRSYWFELWEFYELKHGPSWTWERDSTGKMFTAALLNK